LKQIFIRFGGALARTHGDFLNCTENVPGGPVEAAKAVVGLRPSFSSHVRFGERGAPVDSLRQCCDTDSDGFVGEIMTKGRQFGDNPPSRFA
jgi:hypothetical protein